MLIEKVVVTAKSSLADSDLSIFDHYDVIFYLSFPEQDLQRVAEQNQAGSTGPKKSATNRLFYQRVVTNLRRTQQTSAGL